MDRMNPLDAAFLQVEDSEPEVSLAISSIAVFDGPAPTSEEFTAHIAGRLPLVPRYRQLARQAPLDLGPPVWVDAPRFDLDHHIRRTALPAPGGDAELAALIGRVMSNRLDRNRPLWEYWLVEGLAGGRWALISKVHHCMVDGVSGTDLYHVVLDPTPQPRPPQPDPWTPTPEPSELALLVDAVAGLALLPLAQVRALVGLLQRPAELPGLVRDVTLGALALAAGMLPVRASTLFGRVGAIRRFAFARAATADVRAVRQAFGGTFNDVVLAAVTAGFRALLVARGEDPAAGQVRSLVPVSVRAPGQECVRDNQVSLMLATLPVDVDDPVAALGAVRAQMTRLKTTHEAEAGAAMMALARLEPFPAVAAPVRALARLPQRSVITVTTNVPGPREQLYALGRPLREIIPYVPIASNARTGVSIMSYRDQVVFGVTGDRDSATDVGVLADGISAGLRALADAATSS